MIKIGVFGFGYWGPNLVRNFFATPGCEVRRVVDVNPERLKKSKLLYPTIDTSSDTAAILEDTDIDAVVIALPISFHYEIAKEALLNGKHVLLEKPMTRLKSQARELIDIASDKGKILMVDHTFLYTGAVRKIKEIVSRGELGNIRYFDSTRINLGLFQSDMNVIWDLAPHDISILLHLVDAFPQSVIATGISHTGNDLENLAYLTLSFESNMVAHFTSSWTSPVKIRQILIGGTKKMIVYDDVEPTEKVKVYDTGFEVRSEEEKNKILVDYRVGDIYIPKIDNREALKGVAEDFVAAVDRGTEPVSNWKSGLDVVTILEAAEQSIKNRGREVLL